MSDDFRVNGIDHVELFVPDRRAAAEWYARVLGFEVMTAYEFWAVPAFGPLKISPDGGRTKLALFEGPPAAHAREEVGIRRIAFGVDCAGFIEFVNRLRISKTCELLADGDKPVTDVCFESGVNNISNNNRSFQQLKGMTPSHNRRLMVQRLTEQNLG